METKFVTLTKDNINEEHICCAFSAKECREGYDLKKAWLKKEFDNGYVFRRLDQRAKVFIEYGPAEKVWIPVDAPNYLMINCFWASGQYKGKGYAIALLQSAIDDAKRQKKHGLVTVVGTKKFHFMGEGKWFLRQGFEIVQKLTNGFSLLAMKFNPEAKTPSFKESVSSGTCENKDGLVAYYTNRCPFTEYYIHSSLTDLAKQKNIPLQIIKLNTLEEAQSAPTPATIFSLFYNGEFITTDLSVCTEKRFEKILL